MGRTIRHKSKQDKKRLREYRSLRKKRGFTNPNIVNNAKHNKSTDDNDDKDYQ